jgi:RNA polymerase sigma-70 factor, ECF subfamily
MQAHHQLLSGLLPSVVNAIGLAAALSRFRGVRVRARVPDPDGELLDALRDGDETAFLALVARHQSMLLRLARSFVSSPAVAEEVVQDTWVGVLRGIDGFAGRSTFRTWLLRILVNRARSTGASEGRSVAIGDAAPAVDASRFDAAGAWASPPQHWVEDVEERVLAESLSQQLTDALAQLPARQREVLTLRDVDGLSSREVCDTLGISEGNQRVLLHRARSRMREALELEMEGAA